MFEECFGNGPFIFRINENGTGPQLLTQVCLERGWKEYNSENNENNWNIWWRTSGFSVSHHKSIYAWQFLNHIPKGSAICRKDNLIRYLRCMRKIYGSVYDFSPHGYNLPLEYTKLAAECSKGRPQSSRDDDSRFPDEKPIWICKPVAQSQGRGIFLFKKLSELNYDSNTVVQRYIERPFLIGGYKFDLRLYVCVPSYHPLTIYMYREGLARFGTDKFSLNDLKNPFRHLTNCSINKLGPGYPEMKERVGSGCKWTLRQLRRYFQQASTSDWIIWQRITTIVILTILSQAHQIPPTVNCFEFFGFDILIDSSLRPWLLEVNLSPALSNDCDADRLVKKPMLHDMFDLLGLPLYNTGLSIFNIWLDDSNKENENNEEKKKMSLKETISAISAAGRWRKKYKRMSAHHQHQNSRANKGRTRFRSMSAHNQRTYMKLPDAHFDSHCLDSAYAHNVPKEKPIDEIYIKSDYKPWGNGRDWNCPKPSEGGWVRIWPWDGEEKLDRNNNVSNHFNNAGVKSMVNKIIKFNKIAKELVKTHPAASESQLSEFLQQEMDITGEIWIPPL
ncbi:probable tubulin polyglutamylase TTLL2 [Anthonomus grandis grandis]|uniref:probable tubulin polyglutamylase TTLL2 n=1 Tax=Anthonomus grandis grandis TaxID=2921223 RepID=UPI00216629AE|nr:probable tubulin polyglutamylase TTLL2 [Anthonomus grandis grandis]XP_050309920.1 probable tubulin polyglutamylase TTLL2 [Anthonomus grandis grandis]XP_050309921.1 probable tubulin polyglutamylase TTLL2 [Anthonomus grandis grandis]